MHRFLQNNDLFSLLQTKEGFKFQAICRSNTQNLGELWPRIDQTTVDIQNISVSHLYTRHKLSQSLNISKNMICFLFSGLGKASKSNSILHQILKIFDNKVHKWFTQLYIFKKYLYHTYKWHNFQSNARISLVILIFFTIFICLQSVVGPVRDCLAAQRYQ